jgi:hypothetical protein
MTSASDLPESDPLRVAHQKCIYNRADLQRSQRCGCFYCKKIFDADQIIEWTDTDKPTAQHTALCPFCGIDSVIGDSSGIEMTEGFLEKMHEMWFMR